MEPFFWTLLCILALAIGWNWPSHRCYSGAYRPSSFSGSNLVEYAGALWFFDGKDLWKYKDDKFELITLKESSQV